MLKPIKIKPLPDYKLWIKYSDGVEGEVDLSYLVGKGVFAVWKDIKFFRNVVIGKSGEIRWGRGIELCSDAIYMKITGKSPEEVFPKLKMEKVNA